MLSAALLLVLSALVVVPAVADQPRAEPPPPETKPGPPASMTTGGFTSASTWPGRSQPEPPRGPRVRRAGFGRGPGAAEAADRRRPLRLGLGPGPEGQAVRRRPVCGRRAGRAARGGTIRRQGRDARRPGPRPGRLGADRPGTAAPIVFAACRLGGIPVGPPAPLGPSVSRTRGHSSPTRSAPSRSGSTPGPPPSPTSSARTACSSPS